MQVPESRAATDIWLRIGDLIVMVGSLLLAHVIRFGPVLPNAAHRTAMATMLLYALISFTVSPLYRNWRARGIKQEVSLLALTWLAVFGLFSLHVLLLQSGGSLSRTWLATSFALGGMGMVIVHGLIRLRVALKAQAGVAHQRVLAVGMRGQTLKMHRHLQADPGAGFDIVGYIASPYDRSTLREQFLPPSLGQLQELEAFLKQHHSSFDQVWVSLPLGDRDNLKGLLRLLESYPLVVKLIPDIQGLGTLNPTVEQVGGMPVINLRQGLHRGDYLIRKRVLDICVALVAITLLSPLYLVLAIGVKLSSPGPVFFRQSRHGLNGKEFKMLKFRSMRVHQESPDKITQATRNDPRITKFGGFLRRTSLDELPQFFNVLGGSMSVVGPRPHAIQHNHYYDKLIVRYMQRHYVKPGITGWAQVHGLRGETVELRDMHRRVRYDIDYIRRWSLGLDLRIIVLTAVKVLGQKTAY